MGKAATANKILFYGFFVFLIFILITGWARTNTLLFAIGSIISSALIALGIRLKKIDHPDKFMLWANIVLWANLLGEVVFYYDNFGFSGLQYYDKIFHFLTGILLAAITYHYYSKSLKVKKDMIFLTVLGMLTLWEIYEYFWLIFFNYPTMGVIINGNVIMSAIDDTMLDLIMGSLGALAYLFLKKEDVGNKIKKEFRKLRKKPKK